MSRRTIRRAGRQESSLEKHKLHKKILKPPMLLLPNLSPSPWIHDRLPELLWIVLVRGNIERTTSLDFFRYVAGYVQKHNECSDISHTAIASLDDKQIREFIGHVCAYSTEIRNALRPIALFPYIPNIAIWQELLGTPIPEEDWHKVSRAVLATYDHQSEAATDCRWIKVLCFILGDRMKFAPGLEVGIQEILRFPNSGDLTVVRPTIRSMEMILGSAKTEWCKLFWDHCYKSTGCMPQESATRQDQSRHSMFADELERIRPHYYEETRRIRNKIISAYIEQAEASELDTRREGAFGLALYGITLMIEVNFYRLQNATTGRMALRALVETYITFAYMLKKEPSDPAVWDNYYLHGRGQTKLIYLKLKELKDQVSCVDWFELDILTNEDKWIEFIEINLGNWDTSNLRAMSKFAETDLIYDLYYAYTSGFIHGNRFAVREAAYQKCINVLHRFHRIPLFNLPILGSVTEDCVRVTNLILSLLATAFPVDSQHIITIAPEDYTALFAFMSDESIPNS